MKDIIKLRRERRKKRIRKKVLGTSDRPRLSVHRTLKNMYAQIIDDTEGITILSVSTLDKNFKSKKTNNKESASILGKLLAEKAKEKKVSKVKFDKGHFAYLGRVKALADAARENGLEF